MSEPTRQIQFYGQKQEDRVAYRFFQFFPETDLTKTFLDVGAYDGVHLSNTLVFEQLGWKGICVEADAQAFAQLQRNRRCICLNVACAEKEGTVDFFTEPNRPMGTTDAAAAEKLKAGWHFQADERRQVRAMTVDQILDEHGMREVDFASIDVDGAEVQVLRGFDLGRARPRLICIETNMKQVRKGKWPREHVEEIDRILRTAGYYLLKVHGANSFYARDSLTAWQWFKLRFL